MEATEGSITLEENGMSVEQTLFTYSEEEREEQRLNKLNASLVLNPQFIPINPKMLQRYSLIETTVFGFMSFFLTNNEKFYCTNEQLATMLNTSEKTISLAIKKLSEDGLIELTYKMKSSGGKTRFIRIADITKCNVATLQNVISDFTKCNEIENKKIENKKIKENKKRKFLEYVFLTDEEYNKLVTDYGTKVINSKIEDLNYRIGENPQEKKRQKKSHYNTLLKRLKNAGVEKKRPAPNNESGVYENLREQDLYLQSLIEGQK